MNAYDKTLTIGQKGTYGFRKATVVSHFSGHIYYVKVAGTKNPLLIESHDFIPNKAV